jgi:hypothetical protein
MVGGGGREITVNVRAQGDPFRPLSSLNGTWQKFLGFSSPNLWERCA